MFDSYSRDSFGMLHPQGNCVLIEILSVSDLLEYFRTLHAELQLHNSAFDVKGVQVSLVEDERSECCFERRRTARTQVKQKFAPVSNAVPSFYSLCFSVIKSCIYWDSHTLDAVIEKRNIFYRKLNITVEEHLTLSDLPNKLSICGACWAK